ncbi:MAG: hypothetical protein LBT21_01995 [Oscillospiraceae bacterium]|jgi:hypothetical protein|nr:hypothetical protein [Oscillospiraceae bacterium]
MRIFVGKFCEDFFALEPLSRMLLRIGFWIGYTAFAACWLISVCAGRFGDYWALRFFAEELSASMRSCVGLLGISAFVYQGVHLQSERRD